MLVLSRQKHKSTVIVENTETPLSEGTGNKDQERITTPTLQNNPSLPQIREKKVFTIKQQLAEGRYDLDEGLDAVVESLLVNLTR